MLQRMPTLNPDGMSVKGCKYIYAPAGEAGEYAPLACNPYKGCGHRCAYCYVPLITRQDRREFNSGAVARTDFITNLRKDAAKYQSLGVTGQVLLSFTSDPYHPGDTMLTRDTLKTLIEHGLSFCTLTKGGTRALRDIDLFRPDRDSFAVTLTSLDAYFATRWEPGAAPPASRIAALRKFHDAGIYTWVSLEPTLDVTATLAIMSATFEFVDLYKIGRANYLPMTKTTDWEEYTSATLRQVRQMGVRAYFKKDLQGFLPADYPNELRVQQHH